MTQSGRSCWPKPAAKNDRRKHPDELRGDEGRDAWGAMPAKVSESERAMVTAGLANEVEAVNQ